MQRGHASQPLRKRSTAHIFPPENSPIDFTIAPDGSVLATSLGIPLEERQRPVNLVPTEVSRSWDAQEGFFPRRDRRVVRLDVQRGTLGGNGESNAQSNNTRRSNGQRGER
jgi:hypothetical protein